MAILCLGALLAGLVAAPLMPFLPFACAVLVAILLGAASALVGDASIVQTLLSAVALLFASQVGYGLGVVAVAWVGQAVPAARRSRRDERAARPARALRTGDKQPGTLSRTSAARSGAPPRPLPASRDD